MSDIIFDIETSPLSDDQLRRLLPPMDENEFAPAKFNESSVKIGNLKDPEKIKEKIDGARKKHETIEADKSNALVAARKKHWLEFVDRAPLSPVTGSVLVVAYHSPGKNATVIDDGGGDEISLLKTFWHKAGKVRKQQNRLVGLNIHDFDLPFLVNRSWMLGVTVPSFVFTVWKHRINWDESFVDLRKYWLLGRWGSGTKSSFDHLAAAFGTVGKPQEECEGANFYRMWRENRDLAIKYVKNDVEQPAIWLDAMGI